MVTGSRVNFGTKLLWALFVVALGFGMLALLSDFNASIHKRLERAFPTLLSDDVTGTMTASGSIGNWSMGVDGCNSGEARQYFGAEFYDHRQPQLGASVVLPPDGKQYILVNKPGESGSNEIHREDCQVWKVDLNRTNGRYNGIWAIEGSIQLDCQFHDPKAHLAADIQLNKCH